MVRRSLVVRALVKGTGSSLTLAIACFVAHHADAQYSVDTSAVGGNTEHRLYRDSFHFGSIIRTSIGAVIFRPHPDQYDVNGWGSSYYLNPFLAGGEPQQGVINRVVPGATGIVVDITGSVNRSQGTAYGNFSWSGLLEYDSGAQRMFGTGNLQITLAGPLANAGADLNLSRLASNILTNVPLQTGGTGVTGDMSISEVKYAATGHPRDFTWFPPSLPAHFPQDFFTYLGIDVQGDVNTVDTLSLGEGFQIAIARKPSLELTFTANQPSSPMIFGGIFDTTQARNFAADNVGINHLITRQSTDVTAHQFSLTIESFPPTEQDTIVPAGSTQIFRNLRQNSLSLTGPGAAAIISSNGTELGTSRLNSLTIAGSPEAPVAKLDLTNNAMVLDYAGQSPLGTVRAQVLAGRSGPGFGAAWAGAGIMSSTVATENAAAPESRSIAYAENATLPLGPYTNFRGQPVDATSVLIAYTRTGDANIDGIVNDDDVTIVSAAYAPGVSQPHWALGDFDYNGFVDDDDVTLLGVFYDSAAPSAAAPRLTDLSVVAVVPEPASWLMLSVGALCAGLFIWHRTRR